MARPKGTRNAADQAVVVLSRCAKCNSTEREEYDNKVEVESGGVDADGRPYTHTVFRSTKCKNCGQARRDRTLENRPAPAAAAK